MSRGWGRELSGHAVSFCVVGSFGLSAELLAVLGSRYDVERFGMRLEWDPRRADLMIVHGEVTTAMREQVQQAYAMMPQPKAVLAIGAGAMASDTGVPVDWFVPGNPPRPEAIMRGLLAVQDKFRGQA